MTNVWRKVEPVLWYFASIYVVLLLDWVIVHRSRVEDWPYWSIFILFVVVRFWWEGVKRRVAKFMRESLREMIAQEMAESRVAFVTWLRRDAPWRGENPFSPEQ